MLLVIDAGNTQTVVGLYEHDEHGSGGLQASDGLIAHWRTATESAATADELAMVVDGFLGLRGYSLDTHVGGLAISSGVPRVTAGLREMAARYLDCDPIVIEPGVRTGISILYENPKEVGADRIANAVGAYDLYGGPTIIVDFGTATTCDAVSENGEYLGGAIAPGIEISLDALFGRAAALRAVELTEPRSVLGKSTVDSIRSGTVYGFAAQVDGLCARIEQELGECTIVATGGLADLIAPLSERIEYEEPWLTLHGLRLVYAKNT